jgi:hypothetical protein
MEFLRAWSRILSMKGHEVATDALVALVNNRIIRLLHTKFSQSLTV